MTVTGQNIDIYKGDTKIVVVDVLDSSSIPVDITNCIINYVVYRMTPGTVVLNKTTSSGIAMTIPANGIFEISLDPIDTENLLGYYLHECELTDIAGNISTIFTGKFTVFDSKA